MTPTRWHNLADKAAWYDRVGWLDAEAAHYLAQAAVDLVALVREVRGADPPDPRPVTEGRPVPASRFVAEPRQMRLDEAS